MFVSCYISVVFTICICKRNFSRWYFRLLLYAMGRTWLSPSSIQAGKSANSQCWQMRGMVESGAATVCRFLRYPVCVYVCIAICVLLHALTMKCVTHPFLHLYSHRFDSFCNSVALSNDISHHCITPLYATQMSYSKVSDAIANRIVADHVHVLVVFVF